jgi:hypothetical protein
VTLPARSEAGHHDRNLAGFRYEIEIANTVTDESQAKVSANEKIAMSRKRITSSLARRSSHDKKWSVASEASKITRNFGFQFL